MRHHRLHRTSVNERPRSRGECSECNVDGSGGDGLELEEESVVIGRVPHDGDYVSEQLDLLLEAAAAAR